MIYKDTVGKTFFHRFVCEEAVDHGGPRREFFCLLAINPKVIMFNGPANHKVFGYQHSSYPGYFTVVKFCWLGFLLNT